MTPVRVVVQLIPMLQRVPRGGGPVQSGIHVVVVCVRIRVLEEVKHVVHRPALLYWLSGRKEKRALRYKCCGQRAGALCVPA